MVRVTVRGRVRNWVKFSFTVKIRPRTKFRVGVWLGLR
jgi:hypothetical protein